jgi:hypothetical protein
VPLGGGRLCLCPTFVGANYEQLVLFARRAPLFGENFWHALHKHDTWRVFITIPG